MWDVCLQKSCVWLHLMLTCGSNMIMKKIYIRKKNIPVDGCVTFAAFLLRPLEACLAAAASARSLFMLLTHSWWADAMRSRDLVAYSEAFLAYSCARLVLLSNSFKIASVSSFLLLPTKSERRWLNAVQNLGTRRKQEGNCCGAHDRQDHGRC
jgi:hypothetical protein